MSAAFVNCPRARFLSDNKGEAPVATAVAKNRCDMIAIVCCVTSFFDVVAISTNKRFSLASSRQVKSM